LPYVEERTSVLRIVVLGPGCAQCNDLEQKIMTILSETNISASLEHITDIKEIAKSGIMRTPALLLNSKPVAFGTFSSNKKLKALIEEAYAEIIK